MVMNYTKVRNLNPDVTEWLKFPTKIRFETLPLLFNGLGAESESKVDYASGQLDGGNHESR